jgi:hypothetical protein
MLCPIRGTSIERADGYAYYFFDRYDFGMFFSCYFQNGAILLKIWADVMSEPFLFLSLEIHGRKVLIKKNVLMIRSFDLVFLCAYFLLILCIGNAKKSLEVQSVRHLANVVYR